MKSHPDYPKLVEKTSFLPTKTAPAQRIWHAINDKWNVQLCIVCSGPTVWFASRKNYKKTCCKECTDKYRKSDEAKDMKNASIYPDWFKIKEYTKFLHISAFPKQRLWHWERKDKNIPKCKMCNNAVKWSSTRYDQNCSQKCKYSYTKTVEYQISRKSTNMRKYGVESYSKTQEYKDRAQATCFKKYGVSSYKQTQECQTKIEATCFKKYGVSNCSKTVDCKAKIKTTNLKRYGTSSVSQKHISRFVLTILTNYHYMRYLYTERGMSTIAISTTLGIKYDGTILKYLRKLDIPINHNHSRSYAEREIEDFLLNQNILVESGNRDILQGKEIDLYLPEFKIGIEYNGLYWHTVSPKNERMDRKYHARKTQECTELGIRLIQIFEDEWIYRKDQVKAKLLSLIGKDPRSVIYARKCKILKVTTNTKVEFFDTNHIQGSGPGSINIGLVHDGELVACMSFIKQKNQHYLNRYATSHRIPGGFSKLLKYFKNNYEWELLISFADLRWSDGNLYQKTGWELDKIIPEDYAYVVGDQRKHKFAYRRKFLPNKLETFDPSLSETKNCANNGLYPIYDCGKLRYIMRNN